MTDRLLPAGDGHTELTDDDRNGLIPTYISTRGELFEAEQRNIARALLRRPPGVDTLLDDSYMRRLHRDMFGDVWTWAGTYRQHESNIGIAPAQITERVRDLVDDVQAWIDNATFEADELAVRFHHRLVFIHPFPNGNGRHGRIAADYLIVALGGDRFTWGSGLDLSTDDLRSRYQIALRQADSNDYDALISFARS